MHRRELFGVGRKTGCVDHNPGSEEKLAPDLVERDFTAESLAVPVIGAAWRERGASLKAL